MEFAALVSCWPAGLGVLVLACAELAEVFGGSGVGVAEEVDFNAA